MFSESTRREELLHILLHACKLGKWQSYRPNTVNTPLHRCAMLGNKGVACQRMRLQLGSIAGALLVAVTIMAQIPEHLRYAALPTR